MTPERTDDDRACVRRLFMDTCTPETDHPAGTNWRFVGAIVYIVYYLYSIGIRTRCSILH